MLHTHKINPNPIVWRFAPDSLHMGTISWTRYVKLLQMPESISHVKFVIKKFSGIIGSKHPTPKFSFLRDT